MPVYCLQCPACGRRTEQFARMADRDALTCGGQDGAGCGHPRLEIDYERQTVRPHVDLREFHGEQAESRCHVWNPADVRMARAKFGPDLAECIRDDGTVVFKNRKQERRYVARAAAFEQSL